MPETLTVIISATAEHHVRFLGTLLESLLAVKVKDLCLALSENVRMHMVELIRHRYDVPITVTSVEPGDHPEIDKLADWRQCIQILPNGQPFVCLNVNSLVLRPLGEILGQIKPAPYTLAMPQAIAPTGRRTYYAGMLYGIANRSALDTIGNLWREAQRLNGRPDRLAILNSYGEAVPAAFYMQKAQADDHGGALLATVPTNWVITDPPLSAQTGVFQFPDAPDGPESVAKATKEPDPLFMTWFQFENDYHKRRKA